MSGAPFSFSNFDCAFCWELEAWIWKALPPLACHLSKLPVCLKRPLITKTREQQPQIMTTARFSRWGAAILVLWAGQMPQLCRSDGLFLCFRSFWLKLENSRKIQKITISWGSVSTKDSEHFNVLWFYAHRNCKETPGIPGYWGPFCMREGGSSSYCEVTQVLFVEMEIPGKSCQNSQAIGVIPAKKILFLLELFLHRGWKSLGKQKSINMRLSDVIWMF